VSAAAAGAGAGAAPRFADTADRILSGAVDGGASEAEAFFVHGRELTVKVFDGDVEALTSAESQGVGVRVFADGRMGFAYTSDLSPSGVERVVAQAVDACRYNEPDENNGLPASTSLSDMPELVAADFDARSVEDRVAMALELDRLTAAAHPAVRRTSGAVYSDERGRNELYNTRGLRAAFDATVAYAYVEAIAEQDEEMQSGFSFTFGRSANALDLAACADEAADRAARLLGAAQVASRTTPVLFEPWAAAELIGTLASSISAEAVQKGRSLLAGRLGSAIASESVTIVDDGRHPDGLASRPWDAEGVPTQRTVLVDRGVLQSYLHNTYTARREGTAESTGNASRGSYRATPELAPSNMVLLPGELGPDELLQRMGDGVLVCDVHGLHTVNPVTGEFSLGINGFLVSDGRRGAPVREMTVAGTVLGLLQSVEAVGSDLRWMVGSGFVGAPSLLVRELPLSGS
jgi:PmbA protein